MNKNFIKEHASDIICGAVGILIGIILPLEVVLAIIFLCGLALWLLKK
jgi:hypothetical protein